MSTKLDYSTAESTVSCSARVEYNQRQGGCQKAGKYPDPDGVRWWCGLHNPDRKLKVKPVDSEVEEAKSNVDLDVLADMKTSVRSLVDERIEESVAAMEKAHLVLIEISNINVATWSDGTSVDKFKIIMTHMSDRAREGAETLAAKILKLKA